MIFFRIAFLNLKTHGKRTVLIVFAVALSVVVMVFVGGLLDGVRESFFSGIFEDSGHLQIHEEGYGERLDPYSLEYLIPNPDPVLERLRSDSRVAFAEKLILFGALLVNGEKNLPAGGYGVQPGTDYYSGVREGMVEGSFPGGPDQIAIGRKTAELLDVSAGDELIVLVEDSQGSPFYYQYTVSGVYVSGSEQLDSGSFFITHAAADDLLYLQGATVEIRVNFTRPDLAAPFKHDLTGFFADHSLEAKTWREVQGSFISVFELFDVYTFFIDILIVIVTATVITNAILMNVFERTDEYGTLRAIGLKKRQQFAMIMAEGAVQGLLGSVIGLALGAALTAWFGSRGIDIGAYAGSFGLKNIIRPTLSASLLLLSFGAGILIALAGSLYAGSVSSRKPITEMFAGSK